MDNPFHVDNRVVEWKAMDSPKSPLSMDNDSMEYNSTIIANKCFIYKIYTWNEE